MLRFTLASAVEIKLFRNPIFLNPILLEDSEMYFLKLPYILEPMVHRSINDCTYTYSRQFTYIDSDTTKRKILYGNTNPKTVTVVSIKLVKY